jgi:hypothetical protein
MGNSIVILTTEWSFCLVSSMVLGRSLIDQNRKLGTPVYFEIRTPTVVYVLKLEPTRRRSAEKIGANS